MKKLWLQLRRSGHLQRLSFCNRVDDESKSIWPGWTWSPPLVNHLIESRRSKRSHLNLVWECVCVCVLREVILCNLSNADLFLRQKHSQNSLYLRPINSNYLQFSIIKVASTVINVLHRVLTMATGWGESPAAVCVCVCVTARLTCCFRWKINTSCDGVTPAEQCHHTPATSCSSQRRQVHLSVFVFTHWDQNERGANWLTLAVQLLARSLDFS